MFAIINPTRKVVTRVFAQTIALFSFLTLIACEPVSLAGGGGPSINTGAPVPVALLLPRGSGNANDDALAKSLENAARLAIADLEGVNIDLRVYGTAGNAAQAQTSALQAVSDGAKIILGPVYADNANAVGLALASKGINVLSFSNNTAIAGGNVFVLGPTFQNTADRLVSYAAKNGKKRILVVHSQNVAGQAGAQAIQTAIAKNNVANAGVVNYEFSQNGVFSAVSKITSAARSGNADTVFLTSNTAGALPLFSQLLPESGLNPATTQYIGLTRWDIPAQTLDLPGVQGGWFAMPDPTKTAQFRARYQAAYGDVPHPIGGLAYDGIAAIGALVKAGKSDALTTAALTQSAGFQGVGGIFRLRKDGTNERGLAVVSVQDKKVVMIDPAPRGFGGAGF
ncbi:MAG: penicillin-binding protein activator [Rhodobacterales bacterium]|nr:penicillin-binding protein activator [Rhodobacterales bacterium]